MIQADKGWVDDMQAIGAPLAGVDEAGRGPLAGPVVAAAVILDPERPIAGLADSKALSETARQDLAGRIRTGAAAWSVAFATVEEVDRLNVLHATMLAMSRAVQTLGISPGEVWVDGNRVPELLCPARAIVKGDARIPAISAASILAKVDRDAEMRRLDGLYPGYGFAIHKGYPTRLHREALSRLGPCVIHRRSYAPVRAALNSGSASAEPGPGAS